MVYGDPPFTQGELGVWESPAQNRAGTSADPRSVAERRRAVSDEGHASDSGFRVCGLRFEVCGLRFRDAGLGLRDEGFGL